MTRLTWLLHSQNAPKDNNDLWSGGVKFTDEWQLSVVRTMSQWKYSNESGRVWWSAFWVAIDRTKCCG